MVLKGAMWTGYFYVYEHYRVCQLPWDSVATWVAAAVGADLAYYWIHRAAHGS